MDLNAGLRRHDDVTGHDVPDHDVELTNVKVADVKVADVKVADVKPFAAPRFDVTVYDGNLDSNLGAGAGFAIGAGSAAPPALDDDTHEIADEGRPSRGGPLRFLREWGIVLLVAAAVAVVVRLFVFSPFYIPSGSMEPTLRTNDKILVNKLSYKLHDVHRGDVIVFDTPPGGNFGKDIKDLVKRVIGTPGDTVEIRDCAVFVNGQQLVEPYIPHDESGNPVCTDGADRIVDLDGDGKIQVPAGEFFVMGDNRNPGQSYDGRKWGFLDGNLIVGRAFVIYWPVGRWAWL